RRQNLNFLGRVEVRDTDARAVRTCTNTDCTVKGDQNVLCSATIDVEASLGQAETVATEVAPKNSRLGDGEEQRIAPVDHSILDGLLIYEFVERCRLRLNTDRLCRDAHGFADLSSLQCDVEVRRNVGVNL